MFVSKIYNLASMSLTALEPTSFVVVQALAKKRDAQAAFTTPPTHNLLALFHSLRWSLLQPETSSFLKSQPGVSVTHCIGSLRWNLPIGDAGPREEATIGVGAQVHQAEDGGAGPAA
eukprot:TRINITY_DN23825_c0_g1_i1.p1 TRINITY_DN23825_c0_g1~~TRINITY_DN23825_c0_g1_i1.p1  ORF type:complete len:117 (+),score=6.30 TRINITY_DN23825_c0_g1_i1:595-945(+)